MKQNNVYKVNLREFSFLLWEQLDIENTILNQNGNYEFTRDMIESMLRKACSFAYEVLGPEYQSSDREGCELLEEGKVLLPKSFPHLWKRFRTSEWGRLSGPKEYGGFGAPYILSQVIHEIFLGANPSFITFGGFCIPTTYLIDYFGDTFLKEIFCKKLVSNEWGAALCLTEQEAGSDLGNIKTKAIRQKDGTYSIEGSKRFISAGMHDLTENIIYVLLARAEGAPLGTIGLSCFIVPRYWVRKDGGIGDDNHVRCIHIEQKMGLHGIPVARLTFGDDGLCRGYLLGTKENVGLSQVFTMMNHARITTGLYALGMASSAYLNALEYSRQRIQGVDIHQGFNPRTERVPIIKHVDVRRMLLEMKSKVEGCRALIVKLAYHYTLYLQLRQLPDDRSREVAEAHESLVSLLTPIVKAYTSDQAWRISELAIQVFGGNGYMKDYPVEQYARDVKITSIWEGTNFIQSADLIRYKLSMGTNAKLFNLFCNDIYGILNKTNGNGDFEYDLKKLELAFASLRDTHNLFKKWVRERKVEYAFSVSTRFMEMMAEVTIGCLLLEGAVISDHVLKTSTNVISNDIDFYKGKIASARFFIRNILPGVFTKAEILASEDPTIVEANSDILGQFEKDIYPDVS